MPKRNILAMLEALEQFNGKRWRRFEFSSMASRHVFECSWPRRPCYEK